VLWKAKARDSAGAYAVPPFIFTPTDCSVRHLAFFILEETAVLKTSSDTGSEPRGSTR
jgi:hypothetical protein